MINKFRAWYLRNYEAITWFLIGWLVLSGIYSLGRGDYVTTVIAWGVAVINYIFVKKN